MLLSQLVTGFVNSLLRLSVPVLLAEPSFGMGNATEVGETAVQMRISQTIGLIQTPYALASIFVSLVGYFFCSRYISDSILCGLSQIFVALGFLGVSCASTVWHLAVGQTLLGVGMGAHRLELDKRPPLTEPRASPSQNSSMRLLSNSSKATSVTSTQATRRRRIQRRDSA